MKTRLWFVIHHYFSAGFFSMTIGVVAIPYGILLLALHGLLYWVGYLEIGIGVMVIYVGMMVYRSYFKLQEARKRLAEMQKIQEMEERGIRYF